MKQEDLVKVKITEEMLAIARQDAEFLKSKVGKKTRVKYEDRDIIGSLAHQIVELKLEEFGLAFNSYREVKYEKGDITDIEYDGDSIDVKGTHGTLDQWFYNREFLVFQGQIDDEKNSVITHYAFVLIEPDFSWGYIFGVIEKTTFLEKSVPKKLLFDNQGIRAYQLKPFIEYVFRS